MCGKKYFLMSLTTTLLLCSGGSVFGLENTMRVSGFLTAIIAEGYNDKDAVYGNKIASKDSNWNTRENHLGIQFSNKINSQMSATAQFIAHGGTSNYNLETDWAYIDYKVLPRLRFRIGKYKIPQFILSDYLDVGYAYPWVRPPQDVYATNPLVSLNGIDMLYIINLGRSKILIDLFVGDGTHNSVIPPRTFDLLIGTPKELPAEFKGQAITFDTKRTKGISINYATKTFTLRSGFFETIVDAPSLELSDVPGSFGEVGFTLDIDKIVAYAEFIRRDTDKQMENAFPDQDAWYVTLGYRIGSFLPTLTQSSVKPGVDVSDFAIEQKSTALGLRYDVAPAAAIKFEAMHVVPKEGNHGLFFEPVSQGNVYSLSFDVIF